MFNGLFSSSKGRPNGENQRENDGDADNSKVKVISDPEVNDEKRSY